VPEQRVKKMRIDKQLKKQGFDLDDERTELEVPAEIWINEESVV